MNSVPSPEIFARVVCRHSVSWSEEDLFLPPLAEWREVMPERLQRATVKRQTEWLVGRYCALQALEKAGWVGEPCALGVLGRAPEWPAGFVGSLSHTAGFATAAVAPAGLRKGIGVDSEVVVHPERAERLQFQIMTAEELRLAAGSGGWGLPPAVVFTLFFSAKESLFKCLHPLTGIGMGFQDAEVIAVDPAAGTLIIRLRKRLAEEYGAGLTLTCRWAWAGAHVHTGVDLAPPAARVRQSNIQVSMP